MERIQGHQQHLEAQHCRVIDGVLPPCQPSRPLGWRLGVEGLQKDDLQQQGKYCGRILAHHRAKAARCGAWRVMSRRPHTLLEGRKELKEATVTEQPHQRNLCYEMTSYHGSWAAADPKID
ncbi:hypothetical protein GWK47_037969 [Chionoecetes opilio]|uniref:Uncharacterized protein n=1 Tax=Chionoecetes opilio TaxID=41210 RepID=A0A8J4YMN4_CHIOP|nr:hypothetical protein GWK47_037969 [Chionoecetes opilio]